MRKKFNLKEEGNQRLGTPGSWWEENLRIDFIRTDVRARSCYIQLRIGSSSWYCEHCTEEPVSTATKLSSNTFHQGHRHIFKSRWSVNVTCSVHENCALLGYYAASSGNSIPTFRDNLWVPYSGVENLWKWDQ